MFKDYDHFFSFFFFEQIIYNIIILLKKIGKYKTEEKEEINIGNVFISSLN